MIAIYLAVRSALLTRLGGERGQATSEYALVLVAIALLAGLAIAWASGTDKVSTLLDKVFDVVTSRAGG